MKEDENEDAWPIQRDKKREKSVNTSAIGEEKTREVKKKKTQAG